MATLADKIEHVVVLMMENRSFDHMLGFVPGVGDLTGTESCPSPWGDVPVSPTADYVLPVGPDHTHLGILSQLANGNTGFVTAYDAAVQAARRKQPDLPADQAKAIMRCFAPERVPVLGTLAQHFVACRHWFASVPGETWPNRNYAHAATSHGQVNIVIRPYTDRTIFELLGDNHRSWRIYHDGPAQTWAFPKLWVPFWRHHFKDMDKLWAAIEHDELDHYSFIEPDHGLLPLDKTSNNQHPDNNTAAKRDGSDFRAGEQLIADVYMRLRANPAVFQKTLLLVTYDEHGGFYDKVSPPAAVPPDQFVWQKDGNRFGFDRLGVRVPAVLISPWLDPATIDGPDFEHTSIVASLRALFAPGAKVLNARDGVANGFQALPVRAAPRTDLPAVAPEAMPAPVERQMRLKALAPAALQAPPTLDAFQQSLVALTEAVNRQLAQEARVARTRSRTARRAAPALRFPKAATVPRRFSSHEDLAVYMEYVTRRFHRSVDPTALELTDVEGNAVERPDRAAVERAFAEVDGRRRGRGKVSLRTSHDLVVTAEGGGRMQRIDLETGATEPLPAPVPTRAAGRARARGATLADLALDAIGRPDLR
jgi:phospholipase C